MTDSGKARLEGPRGAGIWTRMIRPDAVHSSNRDGARRLEPAASNGRAYTTGDREHDGRDIAARHCGGQAVSRVELFDEVWPEQIGLRPRRTAANATLFRPPWGAVAVSRGIERRIQDRHQRRAVRVTSMGPPARTAENLFRSRRICSEA